VFGRANIISGYDPEHAMMGMKDARQGQATRGSLEVSLDFELFIFSGQLSVVEEPRELSSGQSVYGRLEFG